MKRRFYTIPGEPGFSKRFLSLDMFKALEYPDSYGMAKRRTKGSRCVEIEITIRRVRMPKTLKGKQ